MLRRLPIVALAIILVLAAFSSGLPFLFYLLYLGILVIGGSYVLTRLGLADLEAGYAVGQVTGHVGEQLKVTYTLRNAGRLPKPWLEVHNPTSLPVAIPGRAIGIGSRAERSWIARVPLTRRGHFRIEPLQVRTGDPFGFFEASAVVGQPVTLVVYPRVDPLPLWRLPSANIEGSHAAPERTIQTSPLATSVRPYAPGDGFNRIHWKSTARQGEIQVKEFDLEQTADVWLFVDLDSRVQEGAGQGSSVELAVRVAASIADKSLGENRAVGLTAYGHRLAVVPADRGGRQYLKLMQLAGRRRRRWQCTPRRRAAGQPAPPPAGDDRGGDHPVARPGLGPAAGQPAGPGHRHGGGGHPGRGPRGRHRPRPPGAGPGPCPGRVRADQLHDRR